MMYEESIPDSPAAVIAAGRAYLGMELGSTRIKSVLVDGRGWVLAVGAHSWQNQLVDGNWTYELDEIHGGVQSCYRDLSANVEETYGVAIERLAGVGVSGMMHGYLAFDKDDDLLTPFRTWRNSYTGEAAALLSQALGANIPLRWSVAHLLHSILRGEDHVGRIAHITTLSGYVHYLLSGLRVLGVGDASGMFPIGADGRDYHATMITKFHELAEVSRQPWHLIDLLPKVLVAGQSAGNLTLKGARFLDPSGVLQPGAIMPPPEGDAGTGMVATHAITPRTGNVSAGTSAFAMIVLEKPLSRPRPQIDMVTTPAGAPVAMIHTNNCAGELDRWVEVFRKFAELLNADVDDAKLYGTLLEAGLNGDPDAGGVLVYNYLSGEHQTDIVAGRPLIVRAEQGVLTLENFMRAQLYGAFGALAVGMRTLLVDEAVRLDLMYAHGGIFRTPGVAQQILADSLGTPVAIGQFAGVGGAWGMALLTAYTGRIQDDSFTGSLESYLDDVVFASEITTRLEPSQGSAGHAVWLENYQAALPVERLAGQVL